MLAQGAGETIAAPCHLATKKEGVDEWRHGPPEVTTIREANDPVKTHLVHHLMITVMTLVDRAPKAITPTQ